MKIKSQQPAHTRFIENYNTFQMFIPSPSHPSDPKIDLLSITSARVDFSSSLHLEIEFLEEDIEDYRKYIKEELARDRKLHPGGPYLEPSKKYEKYLKEMEFRLQYARGRIDAGKERIIALLKEAKAPKITKTLPELFNSHQIFEKCLQVLRNLKIINEENNFIGKLKSSMVIWIKEIERRHPIYLIENNFSNEKYTAALNNYFLNLDLVANNFSQPNKRARDRYSEEFKDYFGKLELL